MESTIRGYSADTGSQQKESDAIVMRLRKIMEDIRINANRLRSANERIHGSRPREVQTVEGKGAPANIGGTIPLTHMLQDVERDLSTLASDLAENVNQLEAFV